MTHKKMNSKIFARNRDGVTLLFVISMVVLFLLMGTTFMIVSNDYYKAARRRSRLSTNIVDSTALLERSFYELFRGPALDNDKSPLRGHSILADQYGYGIVARVEQVFREAPAGVTNPFVELRLSIDNEFTRWMFEDFGSTNNPFSPTLPEVKDRFFNGKFNGHVISIVDGQYAGFSGRIISCAYDDAAMPDQLFVYVLPGASLEVPLQRPPLSPGLKEQELTNLRTQDLDGEQVFATAVINGREFSGVGVGYQATTGLFDTTTGAYDFDRDMLAATPFLNDEALKPNRIGEDLSELTMASGGYLSLHSSTNEPYDIADHQNMFLSGRVYDPVTMTNVVVPSFHRDRLYANQFPGITNAQDIREFSFRPFYVETGGVPNNYSTANASFPSIDRPGEEAAFDSADGSLAHAVNDPDGRSLDVDSDNDGVKDAVWIDIGLPTQTDSEGRSIRPLVAFHVIDLDNRLNLNAHGSIADEAINPRPGFSLGGGYGVAEISLNVPTITDITTTTPAGTTTLYRQLLRQRHGRDNLPGSVFGLGRRQKMFDFPGNPALYDDTSFNTAMDLVGQRTVTANVAGPINNQLPGFSPVNSPVNQGANSAALQNPYNVRFSLSGASGDNLFSPVELEGMLRWNDFDNALISTRLNRRAIEEIEGFDLPSDENLGELFTTHSFEVNIPATPRTLAERINDLIPDGAITGEARFNLINSLTPREAIFGGKLNINRYFGNGEDDDDDNIVDEIDELADDEQTSQTGTPTFDATQSRYLLAKDLYITFLLVCGDTPPPGFTFAGDPALGSTAVIEYHRMVAQWAVNVVDFRDADSINTSFRFDPTPFDGAPFDFAPDPTLTVWGCERPEILINETFAYHDRKNRDTGVGDTVEDGDDDWDSFEEPVHGAIIELYNPWVHPTNFQKIGAELGGPNSVDLAARVNGYPVWRVGVKRERSEDNNDILRTIFFVDPGNTTAEDPTMGTDSFYPETAAARLAPGEYAVMKPFTGDTLDLQLEDLVDVDGDVNIEVNRSRGGGRNPIPNRELSITDSLGGYTVADPFVPVDQPLDALDDTYRTREDLNALWVNGIADNFRYLYLQRLANPTLPYDPVDNPYLTVDTAGIDVLAMNTASNPMPTRNNVGSNQENGIRGRNLYSVQSTFTEYRSVERGASYIAPMSMEMPIDPIPTANFRNARLNMFRADDGPTYPGNGYNAAVGFQHTFGRQNSSHIELQDDTGNPPMPGTPVLVNDRTPFGWLCWNNRPFASHMELLNVPHTPPGLLTYVFNQPAAGGAGAGTSFHDLYLNEISAPFGNTQFQHLLNFSADLTTTPGANRFAHLFEHVETPSLHVGSETYLSVDVDIPNLSDVSNAEFNPRVHGIPMFRTPGKININTLTRLQERVWNNLVAGFGLPFDTFETGRNGTASTADPTDFKQFFTTPESAAFVTNTDDARGGSASTITSAGGASKSPAFNAPGGFVSQTLKKDLQSSSFFANEFRQKLGNKVTTRSSVFAIWITIGYFEVDEFGRLGNEAGADIGAIRRNRGFYVVDRSIPVAFEPGKNHNVDNAVLVKTIIE